jgi:hypothetical protein
MSIGAVMRDGGRKLEVMMGVSHGGEADSVFYVDLTRRGKASGQ